jgi:hypothetical protein
MKADKTKKITGSESRWVIGVDLGQRRDYSAVAALEVFDAVYDERDPISYDFVRTRTHRVRGVERVRLGTPYPDVVRHVRDLAQRPPFSGKCTLVVDGTGVGTPVVDLLRAARPGCRIVPVSITGGDQESSDGTLYRVPKRDLMIGLQVVIEQRRLEIASRSRWARELMGELAGIKQTVTGFGRAKFEAEGSRAHDDLVLAVALAWWWVRKQGPRSCWGELPKAA